MDCQILWNTLSVGEWEERFQKLPRANLLQSYDYARGLCRLNHQKARWGLIITGGNEAGLVQILEAGILWNALHGVILDRGPLWFEGFGGAAHIKSFFEEFNRQFPRRFGRRRRILPEVDDGPAARGIFKQLGLPREETPGYQTHRLDLTQDLETLRAALKKNWRGALNKAARAGLSIEWDAQGTYFSWLMERYREDRKSRGYPGPDPSILQNVVTFSLPNANTIIGRALLDGRAVAAILILCHGSGATYQVGWVSEDGRAAAANHLLLWQACEKLKEKGIKDFDLGGMNDETAKGVKEFKQGLGGRDVRLVGHYS